MMSGPLRLQPVASLLQCYRQSYQYGQGVAPYAAVVLFNLCIQAIAAVRHGMRAHWRHLFSATGNAAQCVPDRQRCAGAP